MTELERAIEEAWERYRRTGRVYLGIVTPTEVKLVQSGIVLKLSQADYDEAAKEEEVQ